MKASRTDDDDRPKPTNNCQELGQPDNDAFCVKVVAILEAAHISICVPVEKNVVMCPFGWNVAVQLINASRQSKSVVHQGLDALLGFYHVVHVRPLSGTVHTR